MLCIININGCLVAQNILTIMNKHSNVSIMNDHLNITTFVHALCEMFDMLTTCVEEYHLMNRRFKGNAMAQWMNLLK